MVGCWLDREEIPAINARAHVDVIEKQPVIVCSVPISCGNYGA